MFLKHDAFLSPCLWWMLCDCTYSHIVACSFISRMWCNASKYVWVCRTAKLNKFRNITIVSSSLFIRIFLSSPASLPFQSITAGTFLTNKLTEELFLALFDLMLSAIVFLCYSALHLCFRLLLFHRHLFNCTRTFVILFGWAAFAYTK